MVYIFFLTFILSACSLLYELIIAQTIVTLVANSVIWYSLTIGFYLVAMGLGAFGCNKFYRKKHVAEGLINIELALTFLGAFSVIFIHCAHILFVHLWYSLSANPSVEAAAGTLASVAFFCIVFIVILLIGFFSGIELPLLIKLSEQLNPLDKKINKVLAFDYFGSLAGGILFPLFLLPRWELLTISHFVSTINFLAAFSLIILSRKLRVKRKRQWAFGTLMGVLLGVLIFKSDWINQKLLQQYYYGANDYYATDNKYKGHFPAVERFHSAYSTIDIIEGPPYRNPLTLVLLKAFKLHERVDQPLTRHKVLYINGDFQFNSDTEEIYHEYFAHVPIIASGSVPHRILVLGAGDGLLIRELLKYPQVEQITHVDIDSEIVRLARQHPLLLDLNKGSLLNPKVKTIIADAYHFVRNSQEKYDAIYMDFPATNDYNLSKLYSLEFYTFVRRNLRDNGFVAFDSTWITAFGSATLNNLGDQRNSWNIFYSTLEEAGFPSITPFFVNLEIDNPYILGLLKKGIHTILGENKAKKFIAAYDFMIKEKGEDFVLQKILKSHTEKLRQGFIMVQKEKPSHAFNYVQGNISFNILNEQRFYRSFIFPEHLSRKKEEDKINSIVRPTLPFRLSTGGIKLPY